MADLDIIKYLKEHDMLFKKQKIEHNYPHCWRCKTPLLIMENQVGTSK